MARTTTRTIVLMLAPFALLATTAPEAAAGKATTRRADVTNDGAEAGSAIYESISGDGRFVAFETVSQLVGSDTDTNTDVYVRDLRARTTERMSVRSNGAAANGDSGYAAISANGRFVSFWSEATNLVPRDDNAHQDVFVHDRRTGATTLVSVSSRERQANGDSSGSAISANGRYIAFGSAATNLVKHDSNGYDDLFVRDTETGTTTRVTVSSSGRQADAGVGFPAPGMISADGRFVVFDSVATNLVKQDSNGVRDVFVHDVRTGRTVRASVDGRERQANAGSGASAISATGRCVSFASDASNLVRHDENPVSDVFVRDLRSGKTQRVSVSSSEVEGDDASVYSSISATGRFVAFDSNAENLIASDTNTASDIFLRDRERGKTRRVSVSRTREQGNGYSQLPYLSADGAFVTFQSEATNLVPNDTNATTDVFVRGPLIST